MSPCKSRLTVARLLSAAGLCVLTAFAACRNHILDVDGFRQSPGPTYLPRTTPQNLLHNLKKAYKYRNIAELESLLAENYTSVISEEDQQKPDMGDTTYAWGHDTEVSIHMRMFDAEYVQTLSLEYTIGDPIWDAVLDMYVVDVQDVSLYLYGSTPGHPTEVREYRVSDGSSRFWFRKNPWTTGARHNSIWTIVRWEDEPVGLRTILGPPDRQSWGSIKARFRLPGFPPRAQSRSTPPPQSAPAVPGRLARRTGRE
jgi:hypothetical protein